MLGHRRPKAVDVSYNSTTLRIYYWHAPLGQDTKLYSSSWRSQYQSRRRQVDLQNRQRFIERGRIVPLTENSSEWAIENRRATGQFDIADERSPEEVAATVAKLGLEPVWKDWDPALVGSA